MVNYARQKHSDEKRLSYVTMDIESELPSDHVEQYDNAVSFYCLHWCNDLWSVSTPLLIRRTVFLSFLLLAFFFFFFFEENSITWSLGSIIHRARLTRARS